MGFSVAKKINNCEDTIIFSDLNKQELLKTYSESQIIKMLEVVPPKNLLFVQKTPDYFKNAKKILNEFGIHFSDAMHTVFAIKNEAILVTRDKHFENVRFIVNIKKPEELLGE